MLADDIHIYLRACAIMGIIPFYDPKKKEFRIYALLPCILITITVLAMLCDASYDIFIKEKVEDINGDIILPIVNVCMNVQMIINLNFLRLGSIKYLFDTFNEIDHDFQHLHQITVPRLKFVIGSFIIINIVFFGMSIIDFCLFGFAHSFFEHFMFYCGNGLSSYNINFIEFLKLLIVYSILTRFRLYNTMTIGIERRDKFVSQRKVEQYIKMHRKLCDLVDCFNHIYGWNMLLSIVQTILFILTMCSMFLNYRDDSPVYLVVMWVVYYTIQGIAFASMCEKVSDQGKKSISLGFKALHRYNNIPVMREKLLILAQQATARCPYFTAAGFFRVDFSMLFTFVNLITTYIIVIVQFSQGSESNTNK